jgi:hypothetical protein
MADYSNRAQIETNVGTNTFKKSEKQPDLTGKIVIDRAFLRSLVEDVKAGVEPTVRIAAWKREGREAPHTPYLFMRMEHNPTEKSEPVVAEEPQDDFNDDIPF